MRHAWSPVFAIGTLHIGHVESASCINFGNNWASDFRSYKKHNQGFGNVTGDRNAIDGLRAVLNDPDNCDLVGAGEVALPEWVSEFLGEQGETETENKAQPVGDQPL
ncbi:MAG: hypothetical protein K6T78_06250 [Alicyclobacillus sp.]|nr:hypothetical protein [Alicyclobacillus sp.]